MKKDWILGAIILVVSVVALVFATVTGWEARRVAQCQAVAIEADRAAFRLLIAQVLTAEHDADEQARIDALREYLTTPPPARCI